MSNELARLGATWRQPDTEMADSLSGALADIVLPDVDRRFENLVSSARVRVHVRIPSGGEGVPEGVERERHNHVAAARRGWMLLQRKP